MAGGSLDFLINIQQKLSGGSAVQQLTALEQKIKAESLALGQLEAAQKRMQKSGSVDIEQHHKLQGAIDAKRTSLAGLGSQYTDLTNAQAAAGASTGSLGEKMSALAGGPVGMVVGAVVALVAIVAVAAFKLASFALGAADAHRSMMLMLQGATGSAAGAQAAGDAIERVAHSSAMAKDALAAMGQSLANAGLRGKLFEDTLKTIALVSSVAGAEAGAKIDDIAKKAAALGHFEIKAKGLMGLGVSMADVAKQMGMSVATMDAAMTAGKVTTEQGMAAMNAALSARFGDAGAKRMLGFDVQMLKLKENLTGLFEGVNIEPFLGALHDLLSIFDQSTVSGQVMRGAMTMVFDGLFSAAATVLPYIKSFLLGMAIGGLQVYLAFMRIKAAVVAAFGGGSSNIDGMAIALNVGKAAAIAIGVVLGALGLVLAAVGAAVYIVISPFIALYRLGAMVVGAVMDVGAALSGAFSNFSLPNLADAAANMVLGLVHGIESKLGDVVASMRAMGTKAKNALLDVLGIHSPSRVMIAAGGYTAQGFAQGVDDSADQAQGAMAKMATPPDMSAAGGRSSKGGRAPVQIGHIGPFYGVGDGRDLVDQIEEVVNAIFERLDLSGPEPA